MCSRAQQLFSHAQDLEVEGTPFHNTFLRVSVGLRLLILLGCMTPALYMISQLLTVL